jgi:hypothetical protein
VLRLCGLALVQAHRGGALRIDSSLTEPQSHVVWGLEDSRPCAGCTLLAPSRLRHAFFAASSCPRPEPAGLRNPCRAALGLPAARCGRTASTSARGSPPGAVSRGEGKRCQDHSSLHCRKKGAAVGPYMLAITQLRAEGDLLRVTLGMEEWSVGVDFNLGGKE